MTPKARKTVPHTVKKQSSQPCLSCTHTFNKVHQVSTVTRMKIHQSKGMISDASDFIWFRISGVYLTHPSDRDCCRECSLAAAKKLHHANQQNRPESYSQMIHQIINRKRCAPCLLRVGPCHRVSLHGRQSCQRSFRFKPAASQAGHVWGQNS